MAKLTETQQLQKQIEELKAQLMAAREVPAAVADRQMEEYVEVELIRDNGAYRDDVFVSVNGENCLIKRGVPVRIKRKFAEVLEQSHQQDIAIMREIERLEADCRKKEAGLVG